MTSQLQQEIRSFGRRRGHALSARQRRLIERELPRYRLRCSEPATGDLRHLFGGAAREVWLEIGFGGGEHLIAQAQANPDVGLIGCEPFVNGVGKLMAALEDHQLRNVRVYDDDARHVLDWLPPASISRAFILFPDPWPKKRHHKRRIFSAENLDRLARVMEAGGILRAATDIGPYAREMLALTRPGSPFRWTAEQAADWRRRPSDWPQTRYESKAIAAGRRCSYLQFERVGGTGKEHMPVVRI